MAISTNDSIQNNSPKPLDRWYAKFSGGVTVPYSSITDANDTIPPDYRSVGQRVLVDAGGVNREYWYQGGVGNGDLVQRDLTFSGGTNTTVLQEGNVVTISTSAITAGESSTTEIFIATGNFPKTFTQGSVLTAFILDPPGTGTITITVGTTPGGGEIFDSYTISALNPTPFEIFRYFKQAETWYFYGIPSGTTVAFYYRPPVQVILV